MKSFSFWGLFLSVIVLSGSMSFCSFESLNKNTTSLLYLETIEAEASVMDRIWEFFNIPNYYKWTEKLYDDEITKNGTLKGSVLDVSEKMVILENLHPTIKFNPPIRINDEIVSVFYTFKETGTFHYFFHEKVNEVSTYTNKESDTAHHVKVSGECSDAYDLEPSVWKL